MGIPDRFLEHASRSEILRDLGLDAQAVAARFLSSQTATV
jgi:deoxyxylulose-5-phosphate synthase